MADRYFPNDLPEFVEEKEEPTTVIHTSGGDSLTKLLEMPYHDFSARIKRAGLDIKETVVVETWGFARRQVRDFSLYTGTLGTAYLQFKTYQVTGDKQELLLSSEIVKASDSASLGSRDVTFICGRAGVCALGAVISSLLGDDHRCSYYLSEFSKIDLPKELPDELFYGRAGFLWACLFINKHIGEGTIPSNKVESVVDAIFTSGRKLGVKGRCPLMYEWYGEKYWGVAHGLAGIMTVLMHVKLSLEMAEEVKSTLKYMIRHRFGSGNFPSSEEDNERDSLVHWCHGAPGVAVALVKAAQTFGDKEFIEAALDAAEVVWRRGLLKRVGICHGICGNTYVFLSLYKLTGKKEFLYKAKAFASFLLDRAHELMAQGEMHRGDHPYSLFEGMASMACLFLDMTKPEEAEFPGYEL